MIYAQPDPRFQEEVKKQISDMDKKHQELMKAMMDQMMETNVKREQEMNLILQEKNRQIEQI